MQKIQKALNRYWIINDGVYSLYYAPNPENKTLNDELICTVVSKTNSHNYIYSSDLLKVQDKMIIANSSDELMEQIEKIIRDYLQDIICKHEKMLNDLCWLS